MELADLEWMESTDWSHAKTFLTAFARELRDGANRSIWSTDLTAGYLLAIADMIDRYVDSGDPAAIMIFLQELDRLLEKAMCDDEKEMFLPEAIVASQSAVIESYDWYLRN